MLTTFAFISATPLGNNYAGLDNVFASNLSVPEPGSLPLIASGMIALALTARRKAKKA